MHLMASFLLQLGDYRWIYNNYAYTSAQSVITFDRLGRCFRCFLYCYRFSVNKDLYYKMIMITFLVIPRGNEIAWTRMIAPVFAHFAAIELYVRVDVGRFTRVNLRRDWCDRSRYRNNRTPSCQCRRMQRVMRWINGCWSCNTDVFDIYMPATR